MQIVIDIDDEDYKRIQDISDVFNSLTSRTYSAIRNGTPLPKGHGRLIDKKEVKKMIEEAKVNSEHSKTFAENIIKFAPTIIEADKAESEIIVLHDRYSNEPIIIRVDAIIAIRKVIDRVENSKEEYSCVDVSQILFDVKEHIGDIMTKIKNAESED